MRNKALHKANKSVKGPLWDLQVGAGFLVFFVGKPLWVGSELLVLFSSGAVTYILRNCFKEKNGFSVSYCSLLLIFNSMCSSVFP